MHEDHSPAPLFELDDDALEAVRAATRRALLDGLAGRGGLPALPAWLPPPPPGLEGEALVLDAGGTRARAAWLRLDAGRPELLAGPEQAPLPTGRGGEAVDFAAFLDVQAELAARLDAPPGLPLGYVFSYPAESLPDGDALPLRWTKDLRLRGGLGEPVGRALAGALARRGLRPGPVRVLNDAVAVLLAGALGAPAGSETLGLVVGTGVNAACFSPGPDRRAINLELGAFRPPDLNLWDEQVDAASEAPGSQRFEKAVSGTYLPRLLAAVFPDLRLEPGAGAELLVELRRGAGARARTAGAILDRSAELVAAALAGLADVLPPGPLRVAGEGGLLWGAEGYAGHLRATLGRLLGERPWELVAPGRATLLGGAVAAILDARG